MGLASPSLLGGRIQLATFSEGSIVWRILYPSHTARPSSSRSKEAQLAIHLFIWLSFSSHFLLTPLKTFAEIPINLIKGNLEFWSESEKPLSAQKQWVLAKILQNLDGGMTLFILSDTGPCISTEGVLFSATCLHFKPVQRGKLPYTKLCFKC